MTTTTFALAGRTIRTWLRTPQLVVVATVQGAMFLLIFRYVFGGAIDAAGVRYVDFLVPGFVVTGLLFSGTGAAAGVAEDVDRGFVDRVRSLPIPRLGILAGRSLADTTLATWGLLTTAAIGFAVGFRLGGDLVDALGALALCVVFAAAFSWVFIAIGLVAGNAQAAQGMSLVVFPLSFVSSAYVPVESMPGWLQPVAANQPLTMMTGAVRGLVLGDDAAAVLGHSPGWFAARALLWSIGIAAVFAPLAVARFGRG